MLDPKKYRIEKFNSLPKEEQEVWIEEVYQHYKTHGFPFHEYDEQNFARDIRRIRNDKIRVKKDVLIPSQTPTTILTYFLPHIWDAKIKHKVSPMDLWNDDQKLKDLIRNRFKHAELLSDSTVRRGIKILCKAPTNFNPSLARFIINKYTKKNSVVYDFCAGWGGRLIGANFVNKVSKYIGVDPSTKTYEGLLKFIEWMDEEYYKLIDIELHNVCAEDFVPKEKVDLIITSPPYFDKEIYTEEKTQSHIKFPTYKEWLENFLIKAIQNGWEKLKKNGHLVLAVKDVASANLYTDLLDALPYKLIKDWKVQYSQIYTDSFKEHLLVYQK